MNSIFWIVAIAVFLFVYLEDKTKAEKKIFGALFITIGIFFLLPIPDYSDFILFPIFSSLSGFGTIEQNVIPYLFFTGAIGIGIIWIGLKLSGKDFNYLKRRIGRIL